MRNVWINRHVLKQVSCDSAGFGGLCMIAHEMAEPGIYEGTIYLRDNRQGNFWLRVEPEAPSMQAHINVAEFGGPKSPSGTGTWFEFKVKPKGYIVLHAPNGPSGYRVALVPRDPKKDTKLAPYDSGKLAPGDRFVVILLRPGPYAARVPDAKLEARISVEGVRPLAGKPFTPGGPHQVVVGTKGFDPAEIRAKQGEGIVFVAQGLGRIVVEHLEPKAADRPKFPRWVNPRAATRPTPAKSA